MRALIFLARRIQPLFLSVVNHGVEFCVLTILSFSTRWAFLFLFFTFLVRKIPFAGIELTSQRVRGLRGTSELPAFKFENTTLSIILRNWKITTHICRHAREPYGGVHPTVYNGCCGVSEVANLLRSGSLLCCVWLPPGITAAEMPLLSFVRPSVFDITIVLPWSYSGSLVPSCWGSCSAPLVLTCVCVSCVLCCLCCPLCVCWYRVHISRVLCGGARSFF